jgi:hypothetical protein
MPSLPSVRAYIRRSRAKKQYEPVNERAQSFATLNPGDHYCLQVWQDGKRKWIKLESTDGNEAVRARIEKRTKGATRSLTGDNTILKHPQ